MFTSVHFCFIFYFRKTIALIEAHSRSRSTHFAGSLYNIMLFYSCGAVKTNCGGNVYLHHQHLPNGKFLVTQPGIKYKIRVPTCTINTKGRQMKSVIFYCYMHTQDGTVISNIKHPFEHNVSALMYYTAIVLYLRSFAEQ